MARGGLQKHGSLALDRRFLKALHDGAAGHRLLGEEVGGPHEYANFCAPRCERRSESRHHRCGSGVMDAAGEQHGQLMRRIECQQMLHLDLPQHQARQRPDVPAALLTFEDEAPRSVLEEEVEEPARRHVQVGGDPLLLQGARLCRPPPGDECHRRPDLLDGLELRRPELRRYEPQDPHPPGSISEAACGFLEQLAYLRPVHQRQRQQRQAARLGDRVGKVRVVADPGHGTLDHRIANPVLSSERRARGERPDRLRLPEVPRDGFADRMNDAACGDEPIGKSFRERGVLSRGEKLRGEILCTQARG